MTTFVQCYFKNVQKCYTVEEKYDVIQTIFIYTQSLTILRSNKQACVLKKQLF